VALVLLLSLTVLALLLIQPLAVVHYSANRGLAHRGNLDKIQAHVTRPGQCLICIQDPHLIVRRVDQPDFFGLNPSIYP
jgi:hypothetical protein